MNWEAIWFLMCVIGWGMSSFLMGYVGKELPYQTALFYQMIGVTIMTILNGQGIQVGLTSAHVAALMNGIFFTIADIAYYKLSESGMDVSTLGPLTSLYVVIPAILGVLILKEPITTRKVIGLFLAITALYLLSSSEPHVPNELSKIEEGRKE